MAQPVILGVDPGSQITGFCILRPGQDLNIKNCRVIDAGVIRPKKDLKHGERLGQIHNALFDIIDSYRPTTCVIEKGFTGINHHTALRLGETRGAIISAARRLELDIEEITPTEVKKLITGNGHATKETIALSLKTLIGFDKGSLPFDVTDAVAIAISYSINYGLQKTIQSLNINGLTPKLKDLE